MNSRFSLAHVEHIRREPKEHAFRYPVVYYAFDLDELEELDRTLPLFGYNRLRPSSLWDRDYLDPGDEPIRDKLRRPLEEIDLAGKVERTLLVTAPRHLNYIFNPVSFFFCLDKQDRPLVIIAEVNNTFGDRHLYVLDDLQRDQDGRLLQSTSNKAFHVSPFQNMQGSYRFSFSDLREGLDATLVLQRNGQDVFTASLRGDFKPLDRTRHLQTLLRHPLRPHLTMPRILWQAFRLYGGKGLKVYTRPVPANPMTIKVAPETGWEKVCRRQIEKLFARIQTGALTLTLWDGETLTFGDPDHPLEANMQIHNPVFFPRLVLGGHIALGETYVDHFWGSDSPTRVVELLIANRDHLDDGNLVSAFISRLLMRLQHRKRDNSIDGSRRNIAAHYDLSNDFYQLFLDPTMTYSCAWYRSEEDTLEKAQHHKLQALIDKLKLDSGHHLLEIGCGWGSFAIEAARQSGCRVTGITLSQAQLSLARQKVEAAGLQDRIDLRLCDYRHVKGSYDRIVSIEMLEAVGHRHFGSYFAALERLLLPGGHAALQVITVPEQRYAAYRRECDWIQKYIFPGGLCPSLEALTRAMGRHSRLTIEHLEDIGPHYARTLREWRERFSHRWPQIEPLGFDDHFRRMWLYYLCYCEAGFSTATLNTLQLILRRQGDRLC